MRFFRESIRYLQVSKKDFERKGGLFFLVFIAIFFLFSTTGYCTVESTLGNIQVTLIGKILPLMAILGVVVAGLSFVAGSQNARSHLVLAMMGTLIGFGAPSIVNFIRGLVQ